VADPRLIAWIEGEGLPATPEALSKLDAFEEALYAANLETNLTRVPRDQFWVRHVADSLLPHRLIPPRATVLDIGSGPGFPSWPIALFRPDLRVIAVDSSGKAVRFLERFPLENLEAWQCRAEELGIRDRFDVVTGRAVAPLSIQLELGAAPCRIGGVVIPFRTLPERRSARSEAPGRLGLRLREEHVFELPDGSAARWFPVFEKIRSTPRAYPRPWAQIRAKPL
jgi:16S rRNA (guanine527-N7)-methyltransferase